MWLLAGSEAAAARAEGGAAEMQDFFRRVLGSNAECALRDERFEFLACEFFRTGGVFGFKNLESQLLKKWNELHPVTTTRSEREKFQFVVDLSAFRLEPLGDQVTTRAPNGLPCGAR